MDLRRFTLRLPQVVQESGSVPETLPLSRKNNIHLPTAANSLLACPQPLVLTVSVRL